MSLKIKGGGITELSGLGIDVDKDWQTFSISDIAAVMAGAAKGDLIVRSDDTLVRIASVGIGQILKSGGVGALPFWQAP